MTNSNETSDEQNPVDKTTDNSGLVAEQKAQPETMTPESILEKINVLAAKRDTINTAIDALKKELNRLVKRI